MSFQAQLHFPVKKRNVSSKKSENYSPKSTSVKRALFGEAQNVASPKKARIANENICTTSPKEKCLPKNVSPLMKAKQAFHISLPNRLVGRSKEITDIHSYISERISNNTSGSLYISGAPGTGKTCSLIHVLENFENKVSFAFVNCMSVSSPATIFKTISEELGFPTKIINSKNVAEALQRHITTSNTPVVIILDEIEQLDCKGQQVLYNLFEWPHLPQSMLTLITIANAMDLTDRILPRLHTFGYQPKLLNFPPYTKEQIISILEDRLSEIQADGTPVIKPIAIQLCARKIAAESGDIRKALNVCMRAIQVVEKRLFKQTLKPISDDRCNPGSPMKRSAIQYVDVQEISAVLHEVYGSRLQASSLTSNAENVTMPLHSMILLCSLILMKKHCKLQDMTMGKAYNVYKKICKKRDITGVNESEFYRLSCDVECRGLLLKKSAKTARLTKIILKIDEKEAEHIMQDKAMLPAILADSSVLDK
ncbi:cell division control protein 6 homolog [Nephila pilipes]|uniref:Cell division control protein n=1 Tax=Nephila pilipes TaxID=299642 RepID=A0A8X6MEU9_NEPPI|nr:cell division control protein 6 homolog [Nephila pilipes]